MRNLKKVLSLALCLVMLLGMMVVGASAAETEYKDAADIENKEAVAVLTKIGVVEGTDGNFNPSQVLNRAEGAAFIYRMLTGGTVKTPSAGVTGFVDVDNNPDFVWAKGIIADLAQKKIISGNDPTHFDPAGELTGAAFGKMLLVALGYNAESQGYTGGGWEGNVIRDAYGRGITVDGVVMTNKITRDQAAQMSFQTLTATMVVQKGGIQVGDVIIPGDLAKDMENNSSSYYGAADGDMQFCEAYFPTLKMSDTTDGYGRPATKWAYNKEAVTTVAKSATKSYTDTVQYKAIHKDLDLTANMGASLTVDGIETDLNSSAAGDITLTSAATTTLGGKGVKVDVYTTTNDAGDITAVDVFVVNTYIGQVSRVSTSGDKTYTYVTKLIGAAPAGVTSFESSAFEKGDYVLYTVGSDDGSTQVIKTMTAATNTQEGTITAKSGSSYVRLDGTKYEWYNGTVTAESAVNVGDKVVLYLDENNNILYAGETESVADQYLYVLGSDKYFNTISLRVVFADGTKETVNVSTNTVVETSSSAPDADAQWLVADTASGTKKAISDPACADFLTNIAGKMTGKVFAYTMDGDDYKLTTGGSKVQNPQPTNASHKLNIEQGRTSLYNDFEAPGNDDRFTSVTANNNTVYVLTDSGTTYTGYKNVPNLNDVAMWYVKGDNDRVADLVFITSATDGDNSKAFYFYVADEDDWEEVKIGNTVCKSYTAYVNGVEQSVVVESTVAGAIDDAGLYAAKTVKEVDGVEYVASLDGTKKVTKTGMGTNQADAIGADNLTIRSDNTYSYDDETVFVYVSAKDKVSVGSETDIIEYKAGAVAGEDITYVYVAEKDSAGKYAKVVYILAATQPNPPAATPTITTDLDEDTVSYKKGTAVASVVALDATATVTDGGTITYQWQKATDVTPGSEDWADIDSATSATYKPVVTATGTNYYRCVITNTKAGCTPADKTSKATPVAVIDLGSATPDKSFSATQAEVVTVTFATTNIADGTDVTLEWWDSGYANKGTAPTNITAAVTGGKTANGKVTLTLTEGANSDIADGDYYYRLVISGVNFDYTLHVGA